MASPHRAEECDNAVVGAGLNGQELLVGWSHQDIKRSKA